MCIKTYEKSALTIHKALLYNTRVECDFRPTKKGGFYLKKLKKFTTKKRVVSFVIALAIALTGAWFSTDFVKCVKIKDESRELTLSTYRTNTNRILSQADIDLLSVDTVKRKEKDDTIYLEVMRAFPVHIKYHNMEHVELMCSGTVSDALKKAKITLSEDDVINVSGDTEVYDSMDIVINEVKYITKTTSEKLKYDTKIEKSEEFPVGYEKVSQKGKRGLAEKTTTYKYVNGEFDSVVGECENVVNKPKDKVIVKGTAQTSQTAQFQQPKQEKEENSTVQPTQKDETAPVSYSKVLTGSATAYTASSGALTATGVPAYVGGVAVNPNIIPYGSKLYIEADGYTYGYATAVDTGGALMSGSALVDLYMNSYDECINFGRRNVKVYILD